VALLAVFLVTIGDTIVEYEISPAPNIYAVVLIAVLVYILIINRSNRSPFISVLGLLLMALIILTHTLASIAFLIIIGTFWLGDKAYSYIYQTNENNDRRVTFFTFSLFLIAMLSYWIFASGHFVFLVKVFRWAFDTSLFTPPPPEKIIALSSQVPIKDILLDRSGYFLLYSLSVLGCLHAFRKRYTNPTLFIIVIFSAVFSLIGFVGSAINAYVQPTRWYFTSQIFLSIPAAIGLLMLANLMKYKNLFLIFIISAFGFLSVSSSLVNSDTPILSSNRTFRKSFIQSEIISLNTIANLYPQITILTDQHSLAYLANIKGITIREFTDQLSTQDFTQSKNDMLLIREYIVNNVFYSRGVLWKLNFDLLGSITQQGFSAIYDSGSVKLFYRIP
jgi:hypothetical protein